MQVIRNAGLDTAYDMDIRDRFGAYELKKKFKKNLEIKRTAYTMIEIYFTDPNAFRAARVAGVTVNELEQGYRAFYNARKTNSYISLKARIHDLDSMINILTDTLTRIRTTSGIFDVLSPARENLVVGAVKGNGNNTGYYVELVQNYEAEKDILVKDRARYVSLMHQYATGTGPGEMPLFQIITAAKPPVDPKGPTLAMVLAICFFIGLSFSSAYVLLTSYYKEVASTRN
jgi:uncharacterized protein involved in exopolysaccharide biosynthesis